MYSLNICHLYPDLLNLYGDRGNIISLTKRSLWRGIDIKIHNISLKDPFESDLYDIVFLGGGQDYEQEIIQRDVLKNKKEGIIRAVENHTVFLCICGGYQLMGSYYRTWDGKKIEGLGAIDIHTEGGKKRLIGNMAFECDFIQDNSNNNIVGFENHSGKTFLGTGVIPLGKVLKGYGNNGEDGYEGAVYKNVYCSYSHGSLLPKNPALADHLLGIALKKKYSQFTFLDSLDDSIENNARNSILKRILP